MAQHGGSGDMQRLPWQDETAPWDLFCIECFTTTFLRAHSWLN